MDKLTKEQIAIFTGVAVVLMLVAFFFLKFEGSYAPVEMIGEVGWFGTITLILALIAPIYTLLYALRDLKVLEPVMQPIKPIFAIKPALAYSLPFIAFGLVFLGMCFGYNGWPIFLYLIGAICAYFIGKKEE